MSRQPTGRIETIDGVRRLVIEREFRVSIDDVWAAVTEPERLARWIGVWTGDPASGHVPFAMTAESVGPGWEYYLDRLGAVLIGGDVTAIDFDRDYYPAMAAHYGG